MRLTLSSPNPTSIPQVEAREHIQPGLLPVFRVLTLLWVLAELAALLLDMLERNIPSDLAPYLLINLADRILLLAYLFTPGLPARMGKWYLPLAIVISAFGPFVSDLIFAANAPGTLLPRGRRDRQSLLIFSFNRDRIASTYLPLILTAWQYGMRGVIIFCTAFIGISLAFPMPSPSITWWDGFTRIALSTVVRTASFASIGYLVARLIAEQKKQREALREANAQLTQYARTMEQLTASRERNRLAHELHDTLAHSQSALAVQLEGVRALLDTEPDEARKLLLKSIDNTRSGLMETRRALKALRASPLDEMGFRLALETLAKQVAARDNLELSLTLDGVPEGLPDDLEQVLYRITQEALENVVRHADASSVDIRLQQQHGKLILRITDDGQGFELQQVETEDTFGLRGIQERAALVGGVASIESVPGTGTSVTVRMEAI